MDRSNGFRTWIGIRLRRYKSSYGFEALYGRIHFTTPVYEEVVISGMRPGDDKALSRERCSSRDGITGIGEVNSCGLEDVH